MATPTPVTTTLRHSPVHIEMLMKQMLRFVVIMIALGTTRRRPIVKQRASLTLRLMTAIGKLTNVVLRLVVLVLLLKLMVKMLCLIILMLLMLLSLACLICVLNTAKQVM